MRNMSIGLAVVEIGRRITPFASFKAGNGLKNTLVWAIPNKWCMRIMISWGQPSRNGFLDFKIN